MMQVGGMNKDIEEEDYPSLYETFVLGDRVKRIYKSGDGKYIEYKGIILAINKNSLEIYWDTVDGKYRTENIDLDFTNCQVDEIFKGSSVYSPILKDK
jgi:hypothetical protein